ncbi:MAG: hypothetical protein AB7J86_13435 [Vulcanimicrobiota bacterium]
MATYPEVLPLVIEQLEAVVRENLAGKARGVWAIGDRACKADTADALDELARELSKIGEWAKEMQSYLLAAWQRRVKTEFGPAGHLGRVLQELADAPDLREVAEMMTEVGAEGAKCGARLPVNEEQRRRFARLRAERDEAYALLAASGAADDVVEFLQAVAEDRATLEQVTPGVFGWLREKGAGGRFRVGL